MHPLRVDGQFVDSLQTEFTCAVSNKCHGFANTGLMVPDGGNFADSTSLIATMPELAKHAPDQ